MTHSGYERRLYRSRHNKVLMGVCGGIAEHFDFNPVGVRLFFVLLLIMTSIFPLLIVYFVMGFTLREAPPAELGNFEHEEFLRTCRDTPELALQKISRRFEQLDQRLQRMESIVTSPRYQFDKEMKNL